MANQSQIAPLHSLPRPHQDPINGGVLVGSWWEAEAEELVNGLITPERSTKPEFD